MQSFVLKMTTTTKASMIRSDRQYFGVKLLPIILRGNPRLKFSNTSNIAHFWSWLFVG